MRSSRGDEALTFRKSDVELSLLTSAATKIEKIVKLEYTGSFFRIVVEIFHREPAISRRPVAARRNGEEFRRKLLRKVIHKIEETKV